MKCGHAITKREGYCKRCGEKEVVFVAKNVTDRLEGREAVCGEKVVKSRWDLPGFIYRPEKERDEFLWGNDKNTVKTGRIVISRYDNAPDDDYLKHEGCE